MKKYVVRPGDTMWNISKSTGVRLNLLMAANPQIRDPNKLQPGTVIAVPELDKGKPGGVAQPPSPAQVAPPTAPGAATPPSGLPLPMMPATPPSGLPLPMMPAPMMPTPPMAGMAGAPKAQAPSAMPPYFGFVWPHVVQTNENWDTVSNLYGVNSTQLKQMNPHHQGKILQPGDIVYVPGAAGSPQSTQMVPQSPMGGPFEGQPPFPHSEQQMPHPMTQLPPEGQPIVEPAPGQEPAQQAPFPMPPMPFGASFPHSHFPYRQSSIGFPMYALPYMPDVNMLFSPPGFSRGFPGYGAFYPPYGFNYSPPAPYGGYEAWMQRPGVPSPWYDDWDESSSWDSSSGSEWKANLAGQHYHRQGSADSDDEAQPSTNPDDARTSFNND